MSVQINVENKYILVEDEDSIQDVYKQYIEWKFNTKSKITALTSVKDISNIYRINSGWKVFLKNSSIEESFQGEVIKITFDKEIKINLVLDM